MINVDAAVQAKAWNDKLCVIFTRELGDDSQRWYQPANESRDMPSVTTIISKIFGKPFPPEASKAADFARRRGKEVHTAIELLCGSMGGYTLDWGSLDDEVAPRVEAFDRWKTKRKWKPRYVERAFWSSFYGFAGTPDQVGAFEDEPDILTVVDFKPAKAPMAALQMAGYAICIKERLRWTKPIRRITLHLTENGAIEDAPHDRQAADRDAFLAALSCFNYGMNMGMWK